MKRTRAGVSLVEIGIFLPIGLMVLGLVWTFFSGSAKTTRRADAKLQGVQANLLLAMQVERDLEALYETSQYQLYTAPPKFQALQFWRCKETSPEENWDPLPIEKITYQFDEATGRVYRTVEDGKPKALHGFFSRVHFFGNQPKAPDDAPGSPLPLTGTVYIWSVAIPQEDFQKPPLERDPFRASTLITGVGRRWYTGRFSYPFWNPVPYYPPPP